MSRRAVSRQKPASARDCDGQTLLEALAAAADWLDAQADRINALNVFPVPDGDTGTNMTLTIRAALEAVQKQPSSSVAEVARVAAHGALLGARGNSGVILSQLLRGFAAALADTSVLGAGDVARALAEAARVAYRGVSKPVEGTLLTVAREVGEAAEAALKLGEDLSGLLDHCVKAAELAVERTPQQLSVLANAGVVDAGGEGYRVLLEGAWMHLTGRKLEMAVAKQPGQVLARARGTEEAPFGFCTELVLSEPGCDLDDIRAAMERLGQSVIVVGDGALVRIHVHAQRPGQVLEFAVDHGTLQQVRIENMQVQHAGFVASHGSEVEGLSKIGVIAVAGGDGFRRIFGSLGVAAVVEGGQSMNPSVQEILASVSGAPYEEVIILPNNGNIIMTANHVRGLTPRLVEVVPTLNVPQGIAAAMAFNYQADLPTNLARMREAAQRIRAVEITRAVRDARAGSTQVTKGQLIALLDGEIAACGQEIGPLLKRALELAGADEREVLTLYYGSEAVAEEAEALVEGLRADFPRQEWEVVRGGQPHYPYIVSLE